MKQKRTSALLTLILAHFLLAFLALSHIVGSLVVIPGAPAGLPGLLGAFGQTLQKLFMPNFGVVAELVGFIIAVVALAVALVFAIVWSIRLMVHRRRCANQFSPLLFLISIFIGVLLVSGHPIVELAFSQQPSRIAAAYWFVSGVIVVALALHLLVVGLANSGSVKQASILPEDIDVDVLEEIDEEVLEDEEEEKEEPTEEVVEEVVEEKAEPVHKGNDLEDPELQALIRKLANEEIDKRPVQERVVVQEVQKVVLKEVAPEPKPEPKPEPAPEVKPVVVVPPAPAAKKETVERVSFPDRMQIVEEPVKADYNLLKNYLLSYGLNSRVSNVADSFRLGRVLYAKLTNSGNSGLKLYLPLNLDDYKDSKIPLKSAEGVKQYEDVPVFIYVRSDLSMKRAQQLIDDVMLKHGLTRKFEAEDVDHVKDLVK